MADADKTLPNPKSTPSPHTAGIPSEKNAVRPKTKEEVARMPGASAPSENEAEGEGDGAKDER